MARWSSGRIALGAVAVVCLLAVAFWTTRVASRVHETVLTTTSLRGDVGHSSEPAQQGHAAQPGASHTRETDSEGADEPPVPAGDVPGADDDGGAAPSSASAAGGASQSGSGEGAAGNDATGEATPAAAEVCTPPTLPRIEAPGKLALVTGAAGFIGSHVARHCAELGMVVVAVDDMSGGFVHNVPDHERISFVQGDVKDADFLDALFSAYAFDFVYHLAAYAAEGLSHFIRSFNYRNNLVGSVELINQAAKHGIKCFVFTSSIAVYGAGQTPMVETMTPQPEDPYGIAKYAVEMDLRAAKHMWGLDFVVFRPHNVYGPGQNLYDRYRNVIGIFMNQLLNGQPMTLFGDGSQTRAFSYIDEVAPVIAHGPLVPEARNQVFNIGADTPYTVLSLAGHVARAMKLPENIKLLDARKEVAHAHSSHAKVACYYGKTDPVPLEEGLKRMVEWWERVQSQAHPASQPTSFAAVEVLAELPPSWKRKDLVQGPTANLIGPLLPVRNNLPNLDDKCGVYCVPQPLVDEYARRVNAVLGSDDKWPPKQVAQWRHPGTTSVRNGKERKSKTLVSIHTAQNAWHVTQLMLVSLAATHDDFDVVLVDDHSDRVDIASKAEAWGVHVLRWGGGLPDDIPGPGEYASDGSGAAQASGAAQGSGSGAVKPKGLTHSWNTVWRQFMDNDQYDNLILANNDLIVPDGTIDRLVAALDSGWAWVLPVVSERGSPYLHHRLHEHFTATSASNMSWTNQVGTAAAAAWLTSVHLLTTQCVPVCQSGAGLQAGSGSAAATRDGAGSTGCAAVARQQRQGLPERLHDGLSEGPHAPRPV